MRSSARSWRFTFIVVLALLLMAIAATAAFAGLGSIEGTVTTGMPAVGVQNIYVTAIPVGFTYDGLDAARDGHDHLRAITGSDGKYKIENVPSNQSYYVVFQDSYPAKYFATQWYENSYGWPGIGNGADPVFVQADNEQVKDINADMVRLSTISGHVDGVILHGSNPPVTQPATGVQVWLWYSGSGLSQREFVQAIETGRYFGGWNDAATDARPHLPRWYTDHMTVTDGKGNWYIANLEPRPYKVYFHDAQGQVYPDDGSVHPWSPGWFISDKPWESGQEINPLPGEDYDSVRYQEITVLPQAGGIHGNVTGRTDKVGAGHEMPLEDIEVSVFYGLAPYLDGTDDLGPGLLLGSDRTDMYGDYNIESLAPWHEYTVYFNAHHYNFMDASTEGGRRHNALYHDWATTADVEPGDSTEVCALLNPKAEVYFVHPPFGVNDAAESYDVAVTLYGWALPFIEPSTIHLHLQDQTNQALNNIYAMLPLYQGAQLKWDDGYGWYWVLHLNLATPKAAVGMYDLHYYADYSDQRESVERSVFQVVSSYTPKTPIDPPAPAVVTPALPATPTPIETPVVTPTPDPVAGPVTVAATKASVKHGAVATLAFQVNEQVLGGTADVKVTITSKAGKVVKTIQARGVKMNAAASVSFRCKLAKGTYSYTVSAGSATATSKLIVK